MAFKVNLNTPGGKAKGLQKALVPEFCIQIKASFDFHRGLNLNEVKIEKQIKALLKRKGLYKKGLGYAGYHCECRNKLLKNGVAAAELAANGVFVNTLIEHGHDYEHEGALGNGNGALDYAIKTLPSDIIKGSALIAVYDLPVKIHKNHDYDFPVNLPKHRPNKGLIALIQLNMFFGS
ncbi:hypothetical protein ACFL4F_03875 [Candidatus Margulisiibacteriota bacterium]